MSYMRNFYVAFSVVTIAVGCASVPDFTIAECDPTPFEQSAACAKAAAEADAGTDAAPDAENALGPEAACTKNGGECVPLPSGEHAALWEHEIYAVWFGSANEMPTTCPFDAEIQLERYAGLHAPPVDCAPCECEPATGQCAGVPASISIGSTMCSMGGGVSVPFDGPGGWDGTCSNDDMLPSGAECPQGSGNLCAKSVTFSTLPPPQNESCAVKPATVPKFNGAITSWEEAAVACHSSAATDTCGSGTKQCAPAVLYPWSQCIMREGKQKECPGGFPYGPYAMYPHAPKDSRQCTECSCGEATGGECVARLRLFEDGICSAQFLEQPISSMKGDCNPIYPAGISIGSKAVTNHLYVPGTCKAAGGDSIGEAEPDVADAVSFCCMPSNFFVD